MVVGFFGYGVSLVLFIVAMRHVGTARAGHGHPGDRRPADGPGSLASPHRAPRDDHPPFTRAHDEHHQHEHPEPVGPGIRHRNSHTQ